MLKHSIYKSRRNPLNSSAPVLGKITNFESSLEFGQKNGLNCQVPTKLNCIPYPDTLTAQKTMLGLHGIEERLKPLWHRNDIPLDLDSNGRGD